VGEIMILDSEIERARDIQKEGEGFGGEGGGATNKAHKYAPGTDVGGRHAAQHL